MTTDRPMGWLTDESMARLTRGGNYSRGTVPLHSGRSAVAKHPVYSEQSVQAGVLASRIERAYDRYGNFSSAHEALGVASEEFDELRDAIRANDIEAIRSEALDLAAVLVRLWAQLGDDAAMRNRSVK